MIGKEDAKNIRNAYRVNPVERHPNDQTSLLSYIKEWGESDKNPVLFYKLQGDVPVFGFEDLKREDFMIVIQTPFQKHMARSFLKNGLCLDSTHGTTGYDFYLTTMLVIDEFGAGCPIAFCLATHETEAFLKIFFRKVQNNMGMPLNPQWLMSDSATQFYNAFVAVTRSAPKYLVCTWHVDKNWRENIRSKIKTSDMHEDIYKRLRILLEESAVNEFERKLQIFREHIAKTPCLAAFSTYFNDKWVARKEQWAFCYRQRVGINCNMYLERFHQTFKYSYLGGKQNKRVDRYE